MFWNVSFSFPSYQPFLDIIKDCFRSKRTQLRWNIVFKAEVSPNFTGTAAHHVFSTPFPTFTTRVVYYKNKYSHGGTLQVTSEKYKKKKVTIIKELKYWCLGKNSQK